jgi:hypothetical protein
MAPALALAMPASAQTKVTDGDCWAVFTVLGKAAAKSPAAKTAMDNGAAAANGAIRRTVPDATMEELAIILQVTGGDLVTAMQNKTITQQQLLERANTCEAQYGLPKTDFSKFQAQPKPN